MVNKRSEAWLFVTLACVLMAFLLLAVGMSLRKGMSAEEVPLVGVSILLISVPAGLCLWAGLRLRRQRGRYLSWIALCVVSPLVLGVNLAPLVMLSAGSAERTWLWVPTLVIFLAADVALGLLLWLKLRALVGESAGD